LEFFASVSALIKIRLNFCQDKTYSQDNISSVEVKIYIQLLLVCLNVDTKLWKDKKTAHCLNSIWVFYLHVDEIIAFIEHYW